MSKPEMLGWCVLLGFTAAALAGPLFWFIGDLVRQRMEVAQAKQLMPPEGYSGNGSK